MNNKLLTIIILTGLAVAFIAISICVFITRGKNKFLLGKKLQVGAVILTLTAFISTCTPQVMCYSVAQEQIITLDNATDDSLIVDYEQSITISGSLEGYYDTILSYSVNDQLDATIDQGYLTPKDGTFNTYEEDFQIELTDILPGNYDLNLYYGDTESQSKDRIIFTSKLAINDQEEEEIDE